MDLKGSRGSVPSTLDIRLARSLNEHLRLRANVPRNEGRKEREEKEKRSILRHDKSSRHVILFMSESWLPASATICRPRRSATTSQSTHPSVNPCLVASTVGVRYITTYVQSHISCECARGNRECLGNNIILAPDVGESRPGAFALVPVSLLFSLSSLVLYSPLRQINLNHSRYVWCIAPEDPSGIYSAPRTRIVLADTRHFWI